MGISNDHNPRKTNGKTSKTTKKLDFSVRQSSPRFGDYFGVHFLKPKPKKKVYFSMHHWIYFRKTIKLWSSKAEVIALWLAKSVILKSQMGVRGCTGDLTQLEWDHLHRHIRTVYIHYHNHCNTWALIELSFDQNQGNLPKSIASSLTDLNGGT